MRKGLFIFLIIGMGFTSFLSGQSRKKVIKRTFYDKDYGEVLKVYGVPDWVITYPDNIVEGEGLIFDLVYLKSRHKPPLDTLQATDEQVIRFKETLKEKYTYDIWSVPWEVSRDLINGSRFIVRKDETVSRFEKFPDYWTPGAILPNFEDYLPEDHSDIYRTR